jgi:ribonuclease-3
VHFGLRPPQLSYAGNPDYQKTWREYVKYRHLLANMPKPLQKDKEKLNDIEKKLVALRSASSMKRDVTIAVSAEGFYTTGIMTDMIQVCDNRQVNYEYNEFFLIDSKMPTH